MRFSQKNENKEGINIMRISNPWSIFDKELSNTINSNGKTEQLLAIAALKRKSELEHEFDTELNDNIVGAILQEARKKGKADYSRQLRCIKRWYVDDIDEYSS